MKHWSIALISLAIAGCSSHSAPRASADTITPKLEALAAKARPGTLAVLMLDLRTSDARGVNVDTPMPMQSVFKLPLAIVVLDAVDKQRLALDDKVILTKDQLSLAHSPIAEAFPGKSEYTIEELVEAAVSQSDNSAADILMKRIGGPAAVTAFFRAKGMETLRVDRYEAELQPQSVGLPPFTGQWIGLDAIVAAQAQVPIEKQRAALRLYLADPRDRMSPHDAVQLLALLAKGRLLSPASTATLMAILKSTSTGADRLKAGLPEGAILYHKTGTGAEVENVATAINDIGIIELKGGRRIAVAAFLSGTSLVPAERAKMIAEVGRIAANELVRTPAVP
jgi:beta-lactamase class A